MPTKIAENLYRQIVPLPNNPLKELNSYIIKGEKNLVIDTGFNRPECKEALQSAFAELGIDETDIFITHLHSDHCGLVGSFASKNSKVYASETDADIINFATGKLYWKLLDNLFVRYGFPRAAFGLNTDIHPGRKFRGGSFVNFTYVEEGDILRYGGYELEVIATPGHTSGHMCLYDRKKKILFCGDHILGTITPNICIELSSENPLKAYLENLKKVDALDVDLLLTAHREPGFDMHARVQELYEHHEKRLAEVLRILGSSKKTAYDVATEMTWQIRCKNWADFPQPQKWFAAGEAAAHLQYLFCEGLIKREEIGGVYYYSRT